MTPAALLRLWRDALSPDGRVTMRDEPGGLRITADLMGQTYVFRLVEDPSGWFAEVRGVQVEVGTRGQIWRALFLEASQRLAEATDLLRTRLDRITHGGGEDAAEPSGGVSPLPIAAPA